MLSPELAILATLKVGVVYKISAPEFITTKIPHYFVVVAINGLDNFLLLSTTQLQKKISHISQKDYDLETLVYIEPQVENGLKADSYFNCNDYYIITTAQLINKVGDYSFEICGNVSKEDYGKLVNGITLSYVNDIPKFLLAY